MVAPGGSHVRRLVRFEDWDHKNGSASSAWATLQAVIAYKESSKLVHQLYTRTKTGYLRSVG